ncbi:Polygalacturonase histidine kinase regulator [Cupriavidus basilensis OR16]|uniref:histidine kinase n=1 Tax=Cupriavidus basilensis OR16 TaxID=1127483 RepID=H1SE89_9BURK|nr:HAMP domain-containing sensor histidine kinase [Cupriavidus basilensis]EHP39176.1 Polygalacturonase histidine kinase regulator [Cupriavidus basilensis OR16]
MNGPASFWSRLNAWRALAAMWRQPEPPEFHWRLLRYFCGTRVAVAVLLLGYAWLPAQRAEAERAGQVLSSGLGALPLAVPYAVVALAMVAATLWWRRGFHLRVRFQVLADLVLLGLIFHAQGHRGEGLAMIFLLPALQAGALTSLLFALFAAAASALVVMSGPFAQTLLLRQADAGLLGSGLYGLVFMIAASLMYLLANRQLAQERLALAREQELRLQQLVNRLMVNDMQDGVMLLRANGAVVAANPAAVVLLGVQPAERGKHADSPAFGRDALFDLRQIPRLQPLMEMLRDWVRSKDDAPRILQLLPLPSRPSQNAMNTGTWNELSPEAAARLRLAIAQSEAMAWRPEDEALLRSEMRDTVLIHIESWERIAEQVQQEKLAAMGRLVASVAHQIRNPLAAISQASELLAETSRRAARPGEAGRAEGDVDARLLRIIHDNVRRLDQVVSDVLQMSRRPRTERTTVDLNQALPEIVGRWRLEMRARSASHDPVGARRVPRPAEINANAVRLTVDVARPVIFDASQLQQVLGNLLDNAWRYCSRLPGAIRLLAHALDQHHAELIVWNDGVEVSREHQRTLFEPFFTSNAQGTGLGLFMARELCGANDAQVRYGTISIDALLAQTGMLAPAARDTLPAKAFVLTLRIEAPDSTGG